MNCRFYEQDLPNVNDFVMVRITEVAGIGAHVELLEYDKLGGMILTSELSRRRIRSMAKLVPVGGTQVAAVIRVDQKQGYIDLSKRRVDPAGKAKCDERYAKSCTAHSMLVHVATTTNTPLENIYTTIGWPLGRKYGHPLDAFKMAAANPGVWDEVRPSAPAQALDALEALVARRLAPQPVKVRADITVTCWTADGVEAVKAALRCARDHVPDGEDAAAGPRPDIRFRVVTSPLYVVTCQAVDAKQGIALLEGAVEAAMAGIRKSGGHGEVKVGPRVVSARDDTSLQNLMEKAERENMEVDGDAASDFEVETGEDD